jgi:uridine kinase
VGVSGIDTAGKTHFAHGLAAQLRARGFHAVLIHLDDFHKPRAERRRGADEVTAYYENAFNLELLTKELLEPLHAQGRLDKRLRLLDLKTDTFTVDRHWQIEPRSIVVLEGSLLLRPPLTGFIDLAVHLEISFDEMLRRAAARDRTRFGKDVERRYREKYIPVQQRYLQEHQPRRRADVVIDNQNPDDPRVVG